MVTDMVKFRKLTRELIAIFPDPSAKPALQTNGLFQIEPVLRPFSRYKIGQNRAEVCKNVQKMADNEGFSRPVFGKRVKPGGPVSSSDLPIVALFRALAEDRRRSCGHD